MSIASYRRNVARGVTGPRKPTCYPAAIEQILPNHALRPDTYVYYKDFAEWIAQYGPKQRETFLEECEEAYDYLFANLGGLSCKDVDFRRANSVLGFKRIVNQLLRDGFDVVVDVAMGHEPHAVGLVPLPEEGYFYLASTHLPKTLQGVVTLDHIGQRLHYPVDRHFDAYPFNDANITAIPAA